MSNRIKCKKCNSILEQLENQILVCQCGEITLNGYNKSIICSKSMENYMEIDDQESEIVANVKPLYIENQKPKKNELIELLDVMIDNIEKLPKAAMSTYINHYDFLSALLLISSVFKSLDVDRRDLN